MSAKSLFGKPCSTEPEGVIRVLSFAANEHEELDDYLEQVRSFADAIIASASYETEHILTIKIHSFKVDPSAFDTFFLSELKSFEGITCTYQGEEDYPCQDHT